MQRISAIVLYYTVNFINHHRIDPIMSKHTSSVSSADAQFSQLMYDILDGTILHSSLSRPIATRIQELITAGANPALFRDPTTGQTALHILAKYKDFNSIELLLRLPSMKPEQPDNEGNTMLHYLLQTSSFNLTPSDQQKNAVKILSEALKALQDEYSLSIIGLKDIFTMSEAALQMIQQHTPPHAPGKPDKKTLENILNAVDKATKKLRPSSADNLHHAHKMIVGLLSDITSQAATLQLSQIIQPLAQVAAVYTSALDGLFTTDKQLTTLLADAQTALDSANSPRSPRSSSKAPTDSFSKIQPHLQAITQTLTSLPNLATTANKALQLIETPLSACQSAAATITQSLVTVPYSFDAQRDQTIRIMNQLPAQHNQPHAISGMTPLHRLVATAVDMLKPSNTSYYSIDLIRTLLTSNPASINTINPVNGNTACHYFSLHSPLVPKELTNHPAALLELLLEHSTTQHLNAQNHQGETVLHTALQHFLRSSNDAPLSAFLPRCNINIQNHQGQTLLHQLCTAMGTLRLRKASSDVDNEKYGKLNTILKDYFFSLTKTTSKASRIDLGDSNGQTALHYAASTGYLEGIQPLLQRAQFEKLTDYIDWVDNKGETALHKAVRAGNVEMVSLLIAQNADVNLANKQGQTPFELAHSLLANPGCLNTERQALQEIQKLLIIANTDLNKKASDGKTPLASYATIDRIALRPLAFTSAIDRIMNAVFATIDLDDAIKNPKQPNNHLTEREKQLAERDAQQRAEDRTAIKKHIADALHCISNDGIFKYKNNIMGLINALHSAIGGSIPEFNRYDTVEIDTLKASTLTAVNLYSSDAEFTSIPIPCKPYTPPSSHSAASAATPPARRKTTMYSTFQQLPPEEAQFALLVQNLNTALDDAIQPNKASPRNTPRPQWQACTKRAADHPRTIPEEKTIGWRRALAKSAQQPQPEDKQR